MTARVALVMLLLTIGQQIANAAENAMDNPLGSGRVAIEINKPASP